MARAGVGQAWGRPEDPPSRLAFPPSNRHLLEVGSRNCTPNKAPRGLGRDALDLSTGMDTPSHLVGWPKGPAQWLPKERCQRNSDEAKASGTPLRHLECPAWPLGSQTDQRKQAANAAASRHCPGGLRSLLRSGNRVLRVRDAEKGSDGVTALRMCRGIPSL